MNEINKTDTERVITETGGSVALLYIVLIVLTVLDLFSAVSDWMLWNRLVSIYSLCAAYCLVALSVLRL